MIIADGWYQPPPRGAAVLAATSEDSSRISFSTLRNEEYWPSPRTIHWTDALLYVYCSPVSKRDGLPGDFAMSLYFGQSPQIRQHFINAHRSISELLGSINLNDTPATIFSKSQAVFEKHHLENTVISITDTTPLDLGHTFPGIEPGQLGDRLTQDQCDRFRRGRLFLNGHSDWSITEGLEFTIEPQLRSTKDRTLPQVNFHYLARMTKGKIELQSDVDDILQKYGLLSS